MAQMTLSEILSEENVVLDNILGLQVRLRASVREKNWITLEFDMETIKTLSARFSELEEIRDGFFQENSELSEEEKNLTMRLHAKLLKSKVENQALNTYIEASQNFVRGILDNVVPQRRNVLYSREGKIIKRDPESIVLNRIM